MATNSGCEYGCTVFTTPITLVMRYAIAIFFDESKVAVSMSLAPFPGPTLDVRDLMQDIPFFIAVLTISNVPFACVVDAEHIYGTDTFSETVLPPIEAVMEIELPEAALDVAPYMPEDIQSELWDVASAFAASIVLEPYPNI